MAEPEHIAKFKRLKKKSEQIIDSTEHNLSGGYLYAVDKVIKDDKGLPDYDLLKKSKYQTKFADEMLNYCTEKAEKAFKIKVKDRDEAEKALLMRAYTGTTKAELLEKIREYKSRFKLKTFEEEIKPDFIERIRNALRGVAAQHLKDEHIDDIINHMKIGHLVNTKYMRIQDAVHLLEQYVNIGAMPEKFLEDQLYCKKKKPA